MAALKLIAYVAFGVLFLSISFTLYSQYQQVEAERRFLDQVHELVRRVNLVGFLAPEPFSITIPRNCQLLFENDFIVARIGERSENFPVEVPVSGPELGEGSFQLELSENQGMVFIREKR
jgi:hypothetical protein